MGTPLPESNPTIVDVTVKLGMVSDTLTNAVSAGPFQRVTPDSTIFCFPGVARYLVKSGSEISIAPEYGVDESQIRLFLLGTAASLLLHQRGLLPLHASGICTPKGAILFTGHSGFGKSTLLATFLDRGYSMLTDDLAAISLDGNGRPQVAPGFPHLKLWADSAKKLDKLTDNLTRVRPEIDKFSVPTNEWLDTQPVPLLAVYALTPSNELPIRIEPLQDARKFNVFLDHTWQKLALKRMNRHAEHFQLAVSVANQVHIQRVYRPEKPFLPHALADLIEADFRS